MQNKLTGRALKLYLLLRLFPRNLTELQARISAVIQMKKEQVRLKKYGYRSEPSANAFSEFGKALRTNAIEILSDAELAKYEEVALKSLDAICSSGPFDFEHCADFSFARAVYLACRAISPEVVVETGVAYGVTSAFALFGLRQNHKGTLWSIDLPPLCKDEISWVGRAIPQDLRDRWMLRRGPSRRLLAPLLRSVGVVDLFVHDSLHTYENMLWGFETVWPFMRKGGVLISDDIQGNSAFHRFARESGASFCVAV